MKKSTSAGSVLALGAVLLMGNAAFAQDDNDRGGNRTSTTVVREDDREEGPNYGWLGLLGLAGLSGLLKKPERQVVHQTDVVRTGSDIPRNDQSPR